MYVCIFRGKETAIHTPGKACVTSFLLASLTGKGSQLKQRGWVTV